MQPSHNVLKDLLLTATPLFLGGRGGTGASVQLWTWCGAAVAVLVGLGRLQLPSEVDLDVAEKCCFDGARAGSLMRSAGSEGETSSECPRSPGPPTWG